MTNKEAPQEGGTKEFEVPNYADQATRLWSCVRGMNQRDGTNELSGALETAYYTGRYLDGTKSDK